MINRVVLVGRLTSDPVLRKTEKGASVTSFTVACDRRVKSQDQTADFINCVAWNNVADATAKYTHKGSLVGAEGRIQTRSYDDKSGKRTYVTEVVAEAVQFLDSRADNQGNTKGYQGNDKSSQPSVDNSYEKNAYSSADEYKYPHDTFDISSDDLPF